MRNQNPKSLIMKIADTPPLLRYNSQQHFSIWQSNAREKLNELLGLELFEKCEDDLKILNMADFENYTDTYFSFQSEPGYYTPCHMLIPKNVNGKIPVILCLQGHTTGMHISLGQIKYDGDNEDISTGDRNYAQLAVKQGYCAITIEQRYMGECGGTSNGPGCSKRPANGINALPTLLFGRTAIGERVYDVIRTIDIISSLYTAFDKIDTENIILTGNSGGGTTTFYAACIDNRIKTAIPSCSVCTYKDSILDINHCACNYIPGIAKYFDMCDLAGLIAPRKLIIVAGKEDKLFPLNGVKQTYSFAKELYKYANAENKIQLIIGNGGHRYYAKEIFNSLGN